MRRDSKLSGVLHVLLHMAERPGPVTSEDLSRMMDTNPVVIRRVMAGLRQQGYVRSEKGHGGGWTLACDLSKVTLRDIYVALGSPSLLAIGNRTESPGCLVEQAVNAALGPAFHDAEQLLLTRFGEVTLATLRAQTSTRGWWLAAIPKLWRITVMAPESPCPQLAFSDARHIARYVEGPPRMVPGFSDMHRMTTTLLAERVPDRGSVLVVGAGGGLELKAFALARPDWTFDGVDPSSEMIRLAERTLGPLGSRVRFHEGIIDAAPAGPFDAATCLLTMHFLEREERLRTALEIHRRLKPGAPFVLVHLSIPAGEGERGTWMSRFAAFTNSSGLGTEDTQAARAAVESHLNILTPEQDEAILLEAGFSNLGLFYAGFTFRGWVAYA